MRLEYTNQELRNYLLQCMEIGDTELLVFFGEVYNEIEQAITNDSLNPKEKVAAFENSKRLISQLKVFLVEADIKLPRALNIRSKMINQEVYCTPLKELKKEAERYISKEDIKTIIYKLDLVEVVKNYMIANEDEFKWEQLKKKIYTKFSEACQVQRKRNRIDYNRDKLDRGFVAFDVRDIKKLDADLILRVLGTLEIAARSEKVLEVKFGSEFFMSRLIKNYTRTTIRQEQDLMNYYDAKHLVRKLIDLNNLKYNDFLEKNPGVDFTTITLE